MQSLAASPAGRFDTAEVFGSAVAEAAEAEWGTGWLSRSDVSVLAAERILSGVQPSVPLTKAGRAPPTLVSEAVTPPVSQRPDKPVASSDEQHSVVSGACPSCRGPTLPEDRFCGSCGVLLGSVR
jgi:serine/threonine-protein kinase